jgi:7-carboxy-7-deazaguanine synthase
MHINIQPIEKKIESNGSVLSVHSIFDTIQGEGPFCGHPAVFVRLAGCNLQCPGCDTEYTAGRSDISINGILEAIQYFRKAPHLVVITGGEPFRQNITPLVIALGEAGYGVQIETNGTLPPSLFFPYWPIVVCSPKAGKINPRMAIRADWFKYVMAHGSVDPTDGLPTLALDHGAVPRVARPPSSYGNKIFLQPMDAGVGYEDVTAENVKACVESCMKYGHILQLQVHKLIGVA